MIYLFNYGQQHLEAFSCVEAMWHFRWHDQGFTSFHIVFHITDDDQFALDLLKDEHVLITAGKGFNWEKPGYFRIVYLPRKHTLHEAMDKLEDFLSYYQQ